VTTVIYLAIGAVVFASAIELAAAARRWVADWIARQDALIADALNESEDAL
jgi:hypothetical protein